MPPLQIPADLEEAIGKFSNVDLRDEAKLEAYSDVADLLSGYVRNAKQYALYPRDTKKFAESVNKTLKTLEMYLEMTTYNDVFTQCVKQWRETTEHIIEFLTDLMKSLDELRLIAATTSKPVSSRDIKAKATTVKPVMLGRTTLPADEQVTIVSEAIDKTGYLQVNTASGERVAVPLINLTAAGENTELLTFFTSSVEKMKQCLDQIRKEVTSKFWAIARSYFQSRSKQELVTIADSKRWKQATDMLLKLDDNSTGFSFKSCINGISNNVIGKKLPDAFEITLDEVESLHDFVGLYQLLLNLLTQASGSLGSIDKLWGEDWQKSLRASSLQIQSVTDQQTGIQQETALQVISNLSATMGQAASEYRHSQLVQQQTTTRRIITTTNSVEVNASSLEAFSQQQQSYRSMRSADSLLQQMHRVDTTDAAKDDILRVSRSSSVTSDSDRWQQGQTRGAGAFASPLPSPVLMSARMESRESRRGIMDDSCSYEVKQREVKTMTDSVTIMSDDDVIEQRAQLQEARRLLTKMEYKTPKTEAACQTDKALESLEQVQKSVRFPTRSQVTDAGCFSDCATLTSSVRVNKSQVTDDGCFSVCATLTSSARVGKESVDRLVQFHRDVPVTDCEANLEIGLKSGFVNYQQPQKTLVNNSVSIGKVLIERSMSFQEDRTVAVSSTQVSKTVDTVAQLVNAKVDYKAGNCRTQSAEVINAGVKWQPEAGHSNMLSLGKPIVDNGVFRINQLMDSWTDMPISKPKESGAHYVQARKDARTQKNPTRTPQVECGVGDNLYLIGGGTDMSVQTAGTRGVIDCGVSGEHQGISTTDGGTGRRHRTRGTDMSERHTICDTGACASTNRIIKIVAQNMALHRLSSAPEPQQQEPSKPQREPEPAKPPEEEPVTQQHAPVENRKPQQSLSQFSHHSLYKAEELVMHGPRVPQQLQPQQQEPSKPQRKPEPAKPPEEEPVTKQHAPVENRKPQQPSTMQTRPQQPQQPQYAAPPTPTKQSRDVPDKEWRYPVHRQDIRPHQDTLPRPQLVFADTGQPLVPQSPTQQQPQTPQQQQQQQQQPPHVDARKPRTYSLPRLHKRPPSSHQTQPVQQQPVQQQPVQQQPVQQQYPPQKQSTNTVDNSKPGFARSQSTRNVGYPTSRSQLV